MNTIKECEVSDVVIEFEEDCWDGEELVVITAWDVIPYMVVVNNILSNDVYDIKYYKFTGCTLEIAFKDEIKFFNGGTILCKRINND